MNIPTTEEGEERQEEELQDPEVSEEERKRRFELAKTGLTRAS